MLRVNADGTIPSDNPFVDGPGANKDEIWAYGLRNPFRFSFDPMSGLLYLGDVGGNDHSTAYEEVDVIVRGANYGWPLCEGPCSVAGVTSPMYSYPHAGRDAAIMGGFVYRGNQFPTEYQGNYFFADYAQNWLKRLTLDASGTIVTGVFPVLPPDGAAEVSGLPSYKRDVNTVSNSRARGPTIPMETRSRTAGTSPMAARRPTPTRSTRIRAADDTSRN